MLVTRVTAELIDMPVPTESFFTPDRAPRRGTVRHCILRRASPLHTAPRRTGSAVNEPGLAYWQKGATYILIRPGGGMGAT